MNVPTVRRFALTLLLLISGSHAVENALPDALAIAAAQEVTPAGDRPETGLPGMRPGAVDGPLPGSIPAFDIPTTDLDLRRIAQPDTYTDVTGRRFALLGNESGWFEAWVWPMQLFRDLRLSFFVSESTVPIRARDIVHDVVVRPASTTITYVYQSFTVRAHVVAAIDEPGGAIFLEIDADHPLRVVAGFIPTMKPMWPAGIGGQYARWDDDARAYLISESSRRHHAFVGSPAGAGMSYTPAHMLGEEPNEFRIDVPDPESVRGRFVPIVIAAGRGERADVRATYDALTADLPGIARRAFHHFDDLTASTMSIRTPEPDLDRAFEWAKISYDGLLADNPDFTQTGLMAGLDRAGAGGRPGFGWFFGGDTYINALSLNAIGMFDASRTGLELIAGFQREDGKMAHEVTQAKEYVDWFGDFPFAYIHADTSPWYIVAVHDHVAATGDMNFLDEQWPAVIDTYEWSLSTDVDGDGLMDNEAAGLGALEFGALTGIRTDIYLGAIWTRSLLALSELARLRSDTALAEEAARRHEVARDAFESFWDESTGQYAYAFDADGETVHEVTPWASVGMLFGFGTPERVESTMRRITRSDLTTDWGVRMLSAESEGFEPLNYNYGAVWPFLTSWTTTAQFLTGRPVQGYSSLMSSVQHVYNRSLGDVTEVMSGIRHTWPQESVPHQGFCTASTVLPVVRGLFGLWYDAPSDRITFGPAVPADWATYAVDGFRYGSEGKLDVDVERGSDSEVYRLSASSPTRLTFRPLLPHGTTVQSVTVNGRTVDASARSLPEGVRLEIDVPLSGDAEITIRRSREPAVIPPVWESPVGSPSTGIRILSISRDGNTLELEVEGLAGRTYELGLTAADRIASVEGARLSAGRLTIVMPTPEARVDTADSGWTAVQRIRLHLNS